MKKVIMLADCQSFYASVEKAANPQYRDKPLVVAGDPERRSGIILAACPIAKSFGVTTAEPLGVALAKCPDLVVIRPRMQTYIDMSLRITWLYNQYTDLVEPYSIDEQFLDVTSSLHLFGGDAEQLAKQIQHEVQEMTGVYIRVGISENKVLAKMACDNFAKKNETGIYVLEKKKLAETLWTLPVEKMFMVGRKMHLHLNKLGIYTIGELAQYPVHKLKQRWGINGEVLWSIANGIDYSPVYPQAHAGQKEIGHHMTLPKDYKTFDELKIVLRELTELVCRQAREKGYMGSVISVSCRGTSFDMPTGFHRQRKIADPTHIAAEMYETVIALFKEHWDGQPVRSIGVSLGQLVSDKVEQLKLFNPYEQQLVLERTTDAIKARFGDTAIMRASSVTPPGQARDRAGKIGGHYK